jgi:hypothetical protein
MIVLTYHNQMIVPLATKIKKLRDSTSQPPTLAITTKFIATISSKHHNNNKFHM